MSAPDTSREVLSAGLLAGRFAGRALTSVAEATRDAIAKTPQPGDVVLDGVARFVTDGPEAAMPVLRDALEYTRSAEWANTAGPGSLWLAGRAAGLAWDFEAWERCSIHLLEATRTAGPASMLPSALTDRAGTLLLTGALGRVAPLAEAESMAIEAVGGRLVPYSQLGLAAFSGRDTQARYLILAGSQDAHRRGDGSGICFVNWAAAVLYNGLGRYEDAYAAAADTADDQPAQRYRNWTLAELIEASVRTGRHNEAVAAMRRLDEVAVPCASSWALGVRARCQALLASGDVAEAAYRDALRHLERTPLLPEVARTHLLFGDWLRRERRAVDARDHLREAATAFDKMGMASFARRASLELAAAGGSAGRTRPQTYAGLTAREEQISRLVAEGATNGEIATRLFITQRTVEYHLHKVFRKLAVTSRTQLARMIIGDDVACRGGALSPRVAS